LLWEALDGLRASVRLIKPKLSNQPLNSQMKYLGNSTPPSVSDCVISLLYQEEDHEKTYQQKENTQSRHYPVRNIGNFNRSRQDQDNYKGDTSALDDPVSRIALDNAPKHHGIEAC